MKAKKKGAVVERSHANGNGHGARLSLGKKYPTMLTVKATHDMQEYVKRKGFAQSQPISGAEYVRRQVFPAGWEKELEHLREIQGPMAGLTLGD